MYSGPQIFMIYYFPMTCCDYQNYGCGVLICTVHFDLYMTENVMGVSEISNILISIIGSKVSFGSVDYSQKPSASPVGSEFLKINLSHQLFSVKNSDGIVYCQIL